MGYSTRCEYKIFHSIVPAESTDMHTVKWTPRDHCESTLNLRVTVVEPPCGNHLTWNHLAPHCGITLHLRAIVEPPYILSCNATPPVFLSCNPYSLAVMPHLPYSLAVMPHLPYSLAVMPHLPYSLAVMPHLPYSCEGTN